MLLVLDARPTLAPLTRPALLAAVVDAAKPVTYAVSYASVPEAVFVAAASLDSAIFTLHGDPDDPERLARVIARATILIGAMAARPDRCPGSAMEAGARLCCALATLQEFDRAQVEA